MWNVVAGGADPAAPTLHPDAGGLPGAATLQRLADGIGGWALIAAMMGIVVGAVIWGVRSANYTEKIPGRMQCLWLPPAAGRPWLAPHAGSENEVDAEGMSPPRRR